MDPLRVIAETIGFFTRGEARDAGYDDRAVQAMMRAHVWVRIRRGFYTFSDLWTALDDVGRHKVRSHAVVESLGSKVALSHVSGAVEHGIATWGVPLDRVHVTRLDGASGRVEPDVVHHGGSCPDSDVVEVHGRQVLVPERCALEAGLLGDGEAALVHLDSLLNLGLADQDRMWRRFETMGHWPRSRHLHIPMRMADGRSASPGESRGRWLCWAQHLPAPVPQYEVFDSSGVLRGTCDWAWPDHRLLGEFDGRVKYGRLLREGQDAGEVVFAEKQREDLLRSITGFMMVRIIWIDYERPRATAHRIREKLTRVS